MPCRLHVPPEHPGAEPFSCGEQAVPPAWGDTPMARPENQNRVFPVSFAGYGSGRLPGRMSKHAYYTNQTVSPAT